eukprot:4575998-Alexandrium_andersonii.AAC.1
MEEARPRCEACRLKASGPRDDSPSIGWAFTDFLVRIALLDVAVAVPDRYLKALPRGSEAL